MKWVIRGIWQRVEVEVLTTNSNSWNKDPLETKKLCGRYGTLALFLTPFPSALANRGNV